MRELRQSTAATVSVGPFLDIADGITPITNLTDESASSWLAKNGAGAAITATSWVHDGNGHYAVGLSTTHTNTAGQLRLSFSSPSVHCPVFEDFLVLTQKAWDAKYGSGAVDANVTQIDGQATNGNNATLNLKQLKVINTNGDAIHAESANNNGLTLVGGDEACGFSATGGEGGVLAGTGSRNVGAALVLSSQHDNGLNVFAGDGVLTETPAADDIGVAVCLGAWNKSAVVIESFEDAPTVQVVSKGDGDALVLEAQGTGKGIVATGIADAVWDAANADYLDAGSTGKALSLSAPAGARQITLQVRVGALAVPDCQVSIYDSANTLHLATVTTDVSGNKIVNLADGTYKLRPIKACYTFTTPQTLVVTADATVAIAATAWAPTAPSTPDDCVIFGWVRDAGGTIVSGAEVTAYARTPTTAGGFQLAAAAKTTTTNATGYFELELVRGAAVELDIPAAGLYIQRIVPESESQDVSTWSA
jgi:hypothetical protein